jgi:hypothetical protein
MADKEYMLHLHTSGDNDNMNSAHILQVFWRAGHSSARQPKEMKTQSKTGGMTFQ